MLGTLEVRRDGAQVPLGGPRQRAVLAALLIRAGRVATVDYLARAVWELPPASLRANLRTYVAGLRRALGSAIVSHPDGYELRVRPEDFDLAVFEQSRRHGLRAERDHDYATAAGHYGHALALWRGNVLDGLRLTGPALLAEATAIEERRLATVERSVETRLLAGGHADTVGDLYRLVAEHPQREAFWAQLMRGLHAAGRQAEALTAYRRARAFCVAELGVEPGHALRRIHRAILDGTLCARSVHDLYVTP
ncbi:BTAD domain-containing putative transcriptional regulator [Umezawaea endophytica]|uniref:AfsR/SARP family transcriptional regulator n=1 Tax=Umezawaea endophytica TaxID=1654476 RepID=A0A9X2VXX7_9PSEU|nr:AfsR/SARP family transcriptional regulator [Umezawaea endophytica]MCS7483758.1 AfsR/SARP family transcriptional regulator [Umezawaea endophytica]